MCTNHDFLLNVLLGECKRFQDKTFTVIKYINEIRSSEHAPIVG